MKKKLFCYQCDKEYEVEIENIIFMKDHNNDSTSLKDDTYYYDDGCFFKTLNRLKSKEQTKEKTCE